MAVKLRLMRMGKKKQPTYRVVAADSRSPRDGRFIEIIGTYEPRQEPSVVKIDNDRALHWLRHGAQPTDRVEKLLKISGAWDQHASGSSAPASAVDTAATATPADDAATPADDAANPVDAEGMPADDAATPADAAMTTDAAEPGDAGAPVDATGGI